MRPLPSRLLAPLAVLALAWTTGLAALHAPAFAVDEPKVDCSNAMTTYEQNYCADKDLAEADKKLNEAYQKLLDGIAKTDGEKPFDAKSWEKALRESQRAWVAFRDADCDGLVPMSWGGGTGTTAVVLGCKTAKTEARTKELLEYAEGM